MAVFSDFFEKLSILGAGPSALQISQTFGHLSTFFGLTQALIPPQGDEEVFAIAKTAALKFWLIQSAIRDISIVINDNILYQEALLVNIDKNIAHLDLASDSENFGTDVVFNSEPKVIVSTGLEQSEFCDFIQRCGSVIDYDFATAAEREFKRSLTSLWFDAEVLRRRPRLLEAVASQTRETLDFFVWSNENRMQQDEVRDLVGAIVKRHVTCRSRVHIGPYTLTRMAAPFQHNLMRYSFFKHFSEAQSPASFFEVLPAEPARRSRSRPSRVYSSKNHPIALRQFSIAEEELPAVYVSHLQNARVFGPACNIATECGRFLCIVDRADWDETCTPMGNSEPEAVLLDQDLEPVGDHESGDHGKLFSASYGNCVRRVDEPAIVIGLRWQNNFGHWLLDMFPRLSVASGAADCRPVYVVVGGPLRPWVKELLNAAGFDDDKIIAVERWSVEFSQLIVPGRLGTIEYGFGSRLRNFYNRFYHQLNHTNGDSIKGPERVFITRSGRANDRRTVLNAEEFRSVLQGYSIVEIAAERLSIRQKIEILKDAKLIILVLGAGYTNLFFAPRSSQIFVILPDIYDCNLDVIEVAEKDQDLTYFYADTVCSDDQRVRTDIVIDCARFKEALDEVIVVGVPRLPSQQGGIAFGLQGKLVGVRKIHACHYATNGGKLHTASRGIITTTPLEVWLCG